MNRAMLLGTLVLMGTANCFAQEAAATAVCAKAKKAVNALADFAVSECMVTKGNGGYTFIFVSPVRIFDNDARSKMYTTIVTAAAGAELNRAPSVKGDQVAIMDKELGERRVSWQIPAATVKSLQQKISTDAITMPQFQSSISKAAKLIPVAK